MKLETVDGAQSMPDCLDVLSVADLYQVVAYARAIRAERVTAPAEGSRHDPHRSHPQGCPAVRK